VKVITPRVYPPELGPSQQGQQVGQQPTANKANKLDHLERRIVWAGKGKKSETLAGFFDELGPERTAELTHIQASTM
jgi:hypothetical protein